MDIDIYIQGSVWMDMGRCVCMYAWIDGYRQNCMNVGMYISHSFTKRGVGNQELPDPSSSVSVSSDKGRQSLPPGTLALLAGPIALMVTQTSKVTKTKGWITERCQSRVISKVNTFL